MTLGRIKSLSFPGLVVGEIRRPNPGSGRLPDASGGPGLPAPVNVTRRLLRARGPGWFAGPDALSRSSFGSPGVCASAQGSPSQVRALAADAGLAGERGTCRAGSHTLIRTGDGDG